MQLNAELLGVEERANEYFASVRFSGLIREAPGAAAEPFVEVWNLSKANRPAKAGCWPASSRWRSTEADVRQASEQRGLP